MWRWIMVVVLISMNVECFARIDRAAEIKKCKDQFPLSPATINQNIKCLEQLNAAQDAEWVAEGQAERAATASDLKTFKEEALKLMYEGLKDAESARVRNVKVIEVNDYGVSDVSLCGEVNAKNSYGGYNGFKVFYVYRTSNRTWQVSHDNFFAKRCNESKVLLGEQ